MSWSIIRLALAVSMLALAADRAVAFPISRGGAHIAAKLQAGWIPIHSRLIRGLSVNAGGNTRLSVSIDGEAGTGALICPRVGLLAERSGTRRRGRGRLDPIGEFRRRSQLPTGRVRQSL